MNSPNNEPDQKNLLLAIVLSAGVLLTWQATLPPPVQAPPQPAPEAGNTTSTTPASTGANQAQAAPTVAKTGQTPAQASFKRKVVADLRVENHHGITLTNDGGQIDSWTLYEDQYRVLGAEGEAPTPFKFVHMQAEKPEGSNFIPPRIDLLFNGKPSTGEYTVGRSSSNSAELSFKDPATGVVVKKTYTVDQERFTVDVKFSFSNPSESPISYGMNAVFAALQFDEDAEPSMFSPPLYLYEAVCQRAEDFERFSGAAVFEAIEDEDPTSFADGIRWGGVDNRYFMTGLLASPGSIKSCSASAKRDTKLIGYSHLYNALEFEGGMLQPGQSLERTFTLYGGPKKRSELDALAVPMTNAIDFGFFSVICVPMLWLMGFFYSYIANWGIAIILLTILVKLITLPLTIKQYRSMGAMKKIQPLMKKLQEKHSEDKVRMQQEMMKLYKEHGVNPLAGCLPMLMMMPIYFALYRTIFSAVELYQANFALWITDLSQQDPYYITPVLLGVLMVVQFKLNPSAGDQMQAKIMMYVMPVMFTAMMLFLPSGLVLYILVNTVLGIVQQYYMYRQAGVGTGEATA